PCVRLRAAGAAPRLGGGAGAVDHGVPRYRGAARGPDHHQSQPARAGGALRMTTPPITPGVRLTMAGLLALLLVASAVTWWLRKKGPAEKYTELSQRVNSWWVMVA